MPFIVWIPFVSVSVLSLVGLWRYKFFPKHLKLFLVFLLICAFTEFGVLYFALNGINTNPSLHFYTVIEFLLLATVLQKSIDSFISRQFHGLIMGGFVVLAILNAVFLEPLKVANSNMLAAEAVLLIILVSLYFFGKFQDELTVPITQDPIFWIASGILLYFSGNLFLFLINEYLSTESFQNYWGYIHNSLLVFRDILFTIAILKIPKS